MSLLWFLLMFYAYGHGADLAESDSLMIAIFISEIVFYGNVSSRTHHARKEMQ